MLVADFEEHAGSMLAWPTRPDIWRCNGFYAQQTVVELAKAISEFEPVVVLASRVSYEHAQAQLGDFANVVEMSFDDIWLRDTSPLYLKSVDGSRAICFSFNAWGGIYSPYYLDDRLSEKVSRLFSLNPEFVDYVLEGGAIVSNGRGVLVTTEECILNPNRNGVQGRSDHEQILFQHTSAEKVIWLPCGLAFDETSGHVDEICCFADIDHVLLAWTDEHESENYSRVRSAYEALVAEGINKITKIALPKQITMSASEAKGYYTTRNSMPRKAGDLYTTSYLNFIFVNGGLIVPMFDDPADKHALDSLGAVFPDRRIVGIPSRELILGGGSFHCIVKDIPATVGNRNLLLSS